MCERHHDHFRACQRTRHFSLGSPEWKTPIFIDLLYRAYRACIRRIAPTRNSRHRVAFRDGHWSPQKSSALPVRRGLVDFRLVCRFSVISSKRPLHNRYMHYGTQNPLLHRTHHHNFRILLNARLAFRESCPWVILKHTGQKIGTCCQRHHIYCQRRYPHFHHIRS